MKGPDTSRLVRAWRVLQDGMLDYELQQTLVKHCQSFRAKRMANEIRLPHSQRNVEDIRYWNVVEELGRSTV